MIGCLHCQNWQVSEKLQALAQLQPHVKGVKDFSFLRAIGKGAFATVYLADSVVARDSRKLYAIKVPNRVFEEISSFYERIASL
jgi:hypothetical protein